MTNTPSSSQMNTILKMGVPVALVLLPLLRKKMGWKVFSVPAVALFAGLWIVEQTLRPDTEEEAQERLD